MNDDDFIPVCDNVSSWMSDWLGLSIDHDVITLDLAGRQWVAWDDLEAALTKWAAYEDLLEAVEVFDKLLAAAVAQTVRGAVEAAPTVAELAEFTPEQWEAYEHSEAGR